VVNKEATITLSKAGLYRFDVQPGLVKVFKGSADVAMNGENTSVGSGKMMTLGAVASVEKFNATDTDTLDRWSHRRAEVLANANVSAAKQAHYGSGGGYGFGNNPCGNYGGYQTPGIMRPLMGTWGYNPYYGFGTYIPCNGNLNSPYGYRYWSPLGVYRAFYAPRPTYPSGGGSPNFGTFGQPSYSTMGQSSGGYSGVSSSAPSVAASAPAASSSGSSAASSAGSSSVGHGAASSGGHGK